MTGSSLRLAHMFGDSEGTHCQVGSGGTCSTSHWVFDGVRVFRLARLRQTRVNFCLDMLSPQMSRRCRRAFPSPPRSRCSALAS